MTRSLAAVVDPYRTLTRRGACPSSLRRALYVTGLVDLEQRLLVDLIEGNRALDVSRWLAGRTER
ncbi:MAG TPA: hypothetical protein VGU73_04580, partial [Acidimicrobiia bacterium]|nr:hypothetical protein [Acidimicrobiia bacterium]